MIDLNTETLVTFTQLARRLPHRRNGRPTHVSTIHRWRLNGLKGVRLAAAKHGAIWVTSIEAYQRFVAALTLAASPATTAPTDLLSLRSECPDRILDKLGL